MAYKQHSYSPPPHKRSSSIVKRDFRRRLRGKPTYNSALLSLPKVIGLIAGKAISLALIIVILAGFLLAGLGSGMLVGYIMTAKQLEMDQVKSSNKNQTTHIVDSAGQDLAILTGSNNVNREYVSISDVKDTWIDEAVMAIEDERFLDHAGIDPKRIGSAILSALQNGGSASHGGSTITQQVVKMLTGADEISAQRKIQEWYNAILLEQKKSKDEVMELYINLMPMGNSYVGLQSAAQAYFGKDASQLNLTECAFLAGIPNRPSTYNPLTETGRRNALRRMRIVLDKMYQLKMITKKQFDDALDVELVFRKTRPLDTSKVNSYFVDYVISKVIKDLQEKRGYSEQMATVAVYNYGLRIETTMDSGIQKKVEETFNDQSLFITNPALLIDMPEKPNGSIVVIENGAKAGQIKAMVGGFGEKSGNFVFNRAVEARRQPGSSIKPLAVYGPALDTGKITAATVFTDAEVFLDKDNPEKPYPRNSYRKPDYLGNMTVREALYHSCNTIAAQIWKFVLGGETSLNYLRMVGIDRTGENYVAIALGGFNKGMTTLEMAGGYSTFANSGIYTEPYAYTRVLDVDGNVLLENVPNPVQVYKPETAFVITSILQDVLTKGTASGYGIEGMHCAGKTGTTDESRDKWFCGYTPYYTAAVWYGYDNRLSQDKIRKEDYPNAIKIWRNAMTKIHEGLSDQDFVMPKTVKTIKVCRLSGLLPGEFCLDENIITEYFIPGAMMNPKTSCNICTPAPTPIPTPTIEPTTEPTTSATTAAP